MGQDSRTIVLTGVTRGLGRSLARGFAARGHRIFGCGRSAEQLASLRQELGGDHSLYQVDVSNAAQVHEWAEEVAATGAIPDLLINNAALITQRLPLWEVPVEELSRIIDVNIKGVAYVIHGFLPHMLAGKGGVVVNFSSGWGRETAPLVAPYCTTKWAIEGLSKAVAQEVPAGFAVIPLAPGIIHTDMLDVAFGEEANAYPRPEEWVDAAVPYLLGLGPEHNGESLRIPSF